MLTKDEFKVLVMLYAANIDSNIHEDEVDEILQKTDAATYEKVRKMFNKMSDMEILDCIRENKDKYAATPSDRQKMLDELRAVIKADVKLIIIEERIYKYIENILKSSK
jgi:hypothetical protein